MKIVKAEAPMCADAACLGIVFSQKICYNGKIMKRIKQKKLVMRKKKIAMPRRPSLFWDVDPKTIDPKKHARYIIERVVDFGTDREARWLYGAYPHSLIRDVVNKSRVVHPQSKVLWESLVRS
jgi:hypothetical protein